MFLGSSFVFSPMIEEVDEGNALFGVKGRKSHF